MAIFCDECQTKVFSYLFMERIEIPVSFSHSPTAITNADLNFVSLPQKHEVVNSGQITSFSLSHFIRVVV